MSSGRGGGGNAVEIPASTKKVVQDLKEVVGYSEEEIYAMLKECNMDPNETAQRLLNQDPFHEVKRKRDKKKESGGAKESQDMRGRLGSGGYPRGGGRSGGGRGGSLPRYGSQGSQEHGGGRGRPYGRENGIHPGSRSSSTVSNSSPAFGQTRPSGTALSSTPSSTAAQPPAVSVPTSTASSGSSGGSAANGSSGYVKPAPGPQGAWASGHGTMADLLKARAAPPSSTPSSQSPSTSPSIPAAVAPSYPAAAAPASSSEASEFYSSSTDPVLDSFVDSVPAGSQNVIGAVGNQRLIGDRFVSLTPAELSLDSSAASSSTQTSAVPAAVGSGETEVEEVEARAASPAAASTPASSSQDTSPEKADVSVEVGNSQTHGSKSVLGGSQFDGRPLYGSPQQPVGTQKAVGGGAFEWKAKASGHGSLGASSDGGSQGLDAVNPTSIAQAYQSLSIQDDEPVIIPTHLRVPEADRSHLSFGSFGADFGTGHGTSFGFAEAQENKKHAETIAVEENSMEMAPPSSVETQVEIVQSYGLQQVATPVENLSASVEAPSVVHPAPVIPAQEQPTKPDPVVQQTPYFLGVSNYSGFGLMPQMPAGQYAYEQTESLPQDVSRIPSMMPTYDPTTSYYTSAFRGADADRLYPPYVPTNTASKYSGNVGLVAAPSLLSSQEGGNPMLASAAPSVSAAQTSQPGSNVQTTQVMPQQALPMHYSQPPSGHFGSYMSYQYMPANYPYLQPPYPHHIYNSNSTSYAQPPAGSTYTPPAATSYPAGGAAGVKFPMPQYKPGAAAGSGPNSALGMGYGGYTTTPSGYASSPAVTAGNASGYEDVNTSHYKDSTLYIPSQQQGDSSTVWIQAAMPREMGPTGTMQTSSYYNLAGQGQHSGYAHSQQPAHGHAHPNAAYANLYHPSQTGLAPSHQILQQPQNMGGGGGNSQAGGYQQQPQRTQQTWNNSNY